MGGIVFLRRGSIGCIVVRMVEILLLTWYLLLRLPFLSGGMFEPPQNVVDCGDGKD